MHADATTTRSVLHKRTTTTRKGQGISS